jgi:hypothetical protein
MLGSPRRSPRGPPTFRSPLPYQRRDAVTAGRDGGEETWRIPPGASPWTGPASTSRVGAAASPLPATTAQELGTVLLFSHCTVTCHPTGIVMTRLRFHSRCGSTRGRSPGIPRSMWRTAVSPKHRRAETSLGRAGRPVGAPTGSHALPYIRKAPSRNATAVRDIDSMVAQGTSDAPHMIEER